MGGSTDYRLHTFEELGASIVPPQRSEQSSIAWGCLPQASVGEADKSTAAAVEPERAEDCQGSPMEQGVSMKINHDESGFVALLGRKNTEMGFVNTRSIPREITVDRHLIDPKHSNVRWITETRLLWSKPLVGMIKLSYGCFATEEGLRKRHITYNDSSI